MGMLDTGGNTLMLALWRDSKYKNAQEHAMHFFFGLGAAIAPLVVAFTIRMGFAPIHAWIATAISLCPCFVGFLALGFTPQPANETEGSIDGGLSKTVLLTGGFLFVYVGCEVAYGGYISSFTVNELNGSAIEGADMTSIYWVMLCVGRFVAAMVTSHVNHTRYLAIHIVMAVVSMIMLTILNSSPGGSWNGTVVATMVFGFALAPLFPGAMLLAEETLGRGMLATEASVIVVLAALGESMCPGIIGFAMSEKTIYFGWGFIIMGTLAGVFFIAVLSMEMDDTHD